MRTTAVGWEIYHRTNQPLSLGLVGLVLALPVIFLALPAGAAADRYSRKKIVMLGQAGMALSGLGLAWTSYTHAPIYWTYLFLLGSGAARALGWPAATAIVPGLVSPLVFPNAAMWRSAAYQLSATLGPLAGGMLLAYHSPAVVYTIDAASSLAQIVSQLLKPLAGSPVNTMLTVAGGGAMTLLTVLWVARRWPALITLGRLDELQPPEASEQEV